MDKAKAEALYRRGLRATVAKVLTLWREITRLRKRVAKLQLLLQEAKRAAKRQAAPFSKGAPKAQAGTQARTLLRDQGPSPHPGPSGRNPRRSTAKAAI